jgi:hypothetical protein
VIPAHFDPALLPLYVPRATAQGTVDAITATFAPTITLKDQTFVAVVSVGANTSTTPTFAPEGLTAHTITKHGGQALVAGDIGAIGFVALFEYNAGTTVWELLNPVSGSLSPSIASPAYSSTITQSISGISQINIGTLTGNLTLILTGKQDGTGSRTLTLDSKFRLNADITAVALSTGANKIDYLGIVYHATDDKYDVVALTKGF